MKETFKNKQRFGYCGLKSFTVFDLILLAMLTAVSIAFKTVVGILVRLITGPLGIPGGALAGGFYMLWLPLAIVLVGKRGCAFVMSAVQTIIMITSGAPGSHGVWTVFTYLIPAVLTEIVFVYRPKKGYNILHYMTAATLANMAGTFGSNLLFFRMSLYPLLFTLLAAATSGALGGVIAYFAYNKVVKSGVMKSMGKGQKTKGSYDDWDADLDGDTADFQNNILENNETVAIASTVSNINDVNYNGGKTAVALMKKDSENEKEN